MQIRRFILDDLFDIIPDELHKESRLTLIRNIHNVKRYTINGITVIDEGRIIAIAGLNSYTMHTFMITASDLKKKARTYWRVVLNWLEETNKEYGLLLATSKSPTSDRFHKMAGFKHLAGVTWCYDKYNKIN